MFRKVLLLSTFISLLSLHGFSYAQNQMFLNDKTLVENEGESAESSKASDLEIYKQDMQKIETYLNNITTLVAPFIQTSDVGEVNRGTFYLSRPGRLRWEHLLPEKIVIIVKDKLLTYYDYQLDEISYVNLDEGLADFLARENIRFDRGEIEILSYDKNDEEISVTIAQKGRQGEGILTLVFSHPEIELRALEVIDTVGKKSVIKFQGITYDTPLEKKLFTFQKSERKR